MKPVLVLFGEMEFTNLDTLCTIHKVQHAVLIPMKLAEKFAEIAIKDNTYQVYVIPSMYNGKIEFKEIENIKIIA